MKYRSIGTTGSRNGLSEFQEEWLDAWLSVNSVQVLHHGDCIGVDEQVATKFYDESTYIIGHPGLGRKDYRAYSKNTDFFLEPKEYLNRNRLIVNISELLLAFPSGGEVDQPRSGTWHTIRYARKTETPHIIVYPVTPPQSFFGA